MARVKVQAHWRDSGRPARLFGVDARASFPLLLFLLHIQWWTLGLALVGVVFFGALERYGFTVPVFLRWLRCQLAGPIKQAIPWWKN